MKGLLIVALVAIVAVVGLTLLSNATGAAMVVSKDSYKSGAKSPGSIDTKFYISDDSVMSYKDTKGLNTEPVP